MDAKIIQRKRINQKLENIFQYPLSIIHAPMGYGKTIALNQFLKTKKVDVVWISLMRFGDTVEYFWDKMCEQMIKSGLEIGAQLRESGFPHEALKMEKTVDIFIDYEYERPVVFVMDDFQVINDNALFSLIKAVVQEKIKNLHIVLITRELAKIDAAGLYQKQLCFTLTDKSLKFNHEEIRQYFNMMDCKLDDEELEKVYQCTDGWISMIYIIMKGMRRGLPIGKSNTVDDIIEQNLYGILDAISKDVLMKLSFLANFTVPMAVYVLNDPGTSDALQSLIKKNTFMVYDEYDKNYRIRNLLWDYLAERARIESIDFRELYKRAGEWYLQEKQYISAFEYFYKAGEVEIILTNLNKSNTPDIAFKQFHQIHRIFEDLPEELCYKYPKAYLQYIRISAMSVDPGAVTRCSNLLTKMENFVRSSDFNESYKNYLLGEINIVWTFEVFNDLEKMIMHNRKASEYFSGGCSCIVTRKKEFTFGSPHLLYCYYRQPGEFKKTAEFLFEHSNDLTAPIDGCGTGCDSTAMAEYALETGDFKNVELHAYKAIYKAKSAEQVSMTICSKFALARFAVLNSSIDEVQNLMNTLKKEVLGEDNPVLNTTFDICKAYLDACIGRYEDIPEWIKERDFSSASFLFQGKSFFYIAYEKVLLLSGDYIKLDALCETVYSYLSEYQNQLGYLHTYICKAAAMKHLQNEQTACDVLLKALTIGQKDHIIMPFAENAVYIIDLLELIHKRHLCDDAYLNDVINYCRDYQHKLKYLHYNKISLTEREQEILRLLEAGDKHAEMGKKLFISVTTVRYHIKNIYQKLNVNNKVLALKKAKELNLLN